MVKPTTNPTDLEALLGQVLTYSRLTKRALARKSKLAPETLSRMGKRGTADFATVAKLVRSAGMEMDVRPPAQLENQHRRLDSRSLALHALIAGKLAADPSMIRQKVLPNIARFKRIYHASGTEKLLKEWEAASRAGMPALLRMCIDPSQRGQQLRQASPLTGILTQEERKSVYDAYAA